MIEGKAPLYEGGRSAGELLQQAREDMKRALAEAKRELVEELRARIPQNTVAICVESGGGTGAGRGELDLYRWIPVLCQVGEREYAYMIALSQQDIDTSSRGRGTRPSGNVHEVFGKLQFWNLGEVHDGKDASGFVGGVPHGAPQKHEGAYLIEYCADKAYPRAERACLKATTKPWGLDFSWPNDIAPILDIADENYDARYVADCFLALVRADIERREAAVEELENTGERQG